MVRVVMSSKGQIVIPKGLRDDLGLAPGTVLEVEAKNGVVEMRRAGAGRLPDPELIDRIGGRLRRPGQKVYTDEDFNAAIAEHIRKEWGG